MPINHFTSCWIREYCPWTASVHCLLSYFATSASPPSHNNSFMLVQSLLGFPIYNIVWRNKVWPRWTTFTECYHPISKQLLVADVSGDDKRPYRKQMWNNLLCLTHMQNDIHKFIYILRAWKKGTFPVSAFTHTQAHQSHPVSLFLSNLFSQLLPMSFPGTYFIYKHLFRYSEEYASIEKGLRSFKLLFFLFSQIRDFPKWKLVCYLEKQRRGKLVWLFSLL